MRKFKGFKLGMLVSAGAVVMAAGTANAVNVISVNPDGAAPQDGVIQVAALDWNVGNLIALGGNSAVSTFAATAHVDPTTGRLVGGVQSTIQVYYQASLSSFNGTGGSIFTNLHNTYEWTIVAGFQEVVSSIQGNNVQFDFLPGSGNFINIYYDPSKNANDLAGTGFNDGTLILTAHSTSFSSTSGFTADQTKQVAFDQSADGNNYVGITSVTGDGSTTINAVVDSLPGGGFFVGPNQLSVFDLSIFTSQLNLPFTGVNPSRQFFDGTALFAESSGTPGVGIGSYNGSNTPGGNGGPDIQIQTDASQVFETAPTFVPEPATAALGLMGLIGMAFASRRRRNA